MLYIKALLRCLPMLLGTLPMLTILWKFSWLDYLPVEVSDDQWKKLCPSIIKKLQGRPVLQSWEYGLFKLPANVRQLPAFALDEAQPILADLSAENYLAPQYRTEHKKTLEALGVSQITCSQKWIALGRTLTSKLHGGVVM
jgi:hypothetical protein